VTDGYDVGESWFGADDDIHTKILSEVFQSDLSFYKLICYILERKMKALYNAGKTAW
jgi:hypothetical protein